VCQFFFTIFFSNLNEKNCSGKILTPPEYPLFYSNNFLIALRTLALSNHLHFKNHPILIGASKKLGMSIAIDSMEMDRWVECRLKAHAIDRLKTRVDIELEETCGTY
jgi:hypothetical protein